MRHRTVCREVGHQYLFVGVQYLRTFAHKGHAAKYDDVCRTLLGDLCKIEGVANVVGYLLRLGRCIVMRQYDGIFLFLQFFNPILHNQPFLSC